MITNAPSWITPKGFLFTATELIFNSYTVTATNTSSYLLLNGSLPNGMALSTITGVISGVPDAVLNITSNQFTIRAYNNAASVDRTFRIDVKDSDIPIWNTITITTGSGGLTTTTNEGYLPLGLQNQPYALNKQYIDFQFVAGSNQAPADTKIQYYIPDQGGILPNNLKLSKSGRLTGILDCFTDADLNTATNTYTVYIPKEFQFYISATDSVREQNKLFKMVVVDPTMLRFWNTQSSTNIEILDVSLNTQPYSYLQPPQYTIDTNLGTFRADNYHIISIPAYDPAPLIGTLTYALITGTTLSTNLPYGLNLEPNKGLIYGYLPYQSAYSKSYQFTIEAIKTDALSTVTEITTGTFINSISTSTKTVFDLTVKGIVERTLEWVTTSSLGSIYEGQISELYVKATEPTSEYNIKYVKTAGTLPQGLDLLSDGTLIGKVDYNSSGTYSFTVKAKDIYDLSAVEQTFSLNVLPADKEYTEIYIKTFLSKDKKTIYSDFINNEDIFDPKLIYRYFDQNFGVQVEPKIVLEFGIEKIEIEDFYTVLNTNFYRRKFYFGELKIITAKNEFGTPMYELIYAEVLDNLYVNQKSVSLTVDINNNTYYPASIDNMRYRLENILVNNLTKISTDGKYNPQFFNESTQIENNVVKFAKFIPICYALPEQGNKILNRINFSGFNFKQFLIETDRLIVKENLSTTGEKYLFFPKRNIKL